LQKLSHLQILRLFLIFLALLVVGSCKKIEELNVQPELEPLQQGLKTSAALGYCASVAAAAFQGHTVPPNVVYNENTGMIYIHIDQNYPLPFNKNIGEIIIAGIWNGNSGLISVLFANIDILGGNVRLYGFYTIPIIVNDSDESIVTLFAKQDIIVGYGSDTILNLGNITETVFNSELSRLNMEKPSDVFVAVRQNVWFINIDRANTCNNIYDDDLVVNGGGQIVEIKSTSGGVLYHALLNTRINYSICPANPLSGYSLLQNIRSGGNILLDIGNVLFSFNNNCNGLVHIDLSTGKYLNYNGKELPLGL
jgi:hypothetical protein